jgi:hypothetical protein
VRDLVIGRLAPLVVVALAACQPLPQPFAEHRPPPGAPILTMKDAGGVLVEPLEAAPDAAERMADALRRAGTPASTSASNRASWRLAGRLEGGAPVWDLYNPAGVLVGSAAEARRIAALVQDEAPVEVRPETPVIAVPLVEGAPGDGSRALARAMTTALRNASLAVDDQAPQPWIVAGRVAVAPPANQQQHVAVVWELRKPDGEKVFEVKQENDVPAGQLDGAWGDIAWAVASAAAEALVPLIEKAARS